MPAEFLRSLLRGNGGAVEGESARRGRQPEVALVGGWGIESGFVG